MRQVVTRQHNKIITDNPRIVSMVPSLTELLYDLDLLANIVGCTKFCVHPQKLLKDIPKLQLLKMWSVTIYYFVSNFF